MYMVVLSSYADLRQNDLDRISGIIDQKLESMKLDIAEMKGKVATKEWLLTMWITIFLSILAVPYLYGRGDRERLKELEARLREDKKRIEQIKSELESKIEKETHEYLRESARKLAEEKPEYTKGFKRIGLL